MRKQVAGRMRVLQPERFPVRRLPAQRQPLVVQSAEHLLPLRAHLESIVREAVAERVENVIRPVDSSHLHVRAPLVQPDLLDQASGTACTLCRGACCLDGATRMAYLTPETIGRVIGARPDATASALVEEYLSFAPARVTEGGCYFHGSRGCTLPRDLRSETCNRYFCDELQQFRSEALAVQSNGLPAEPVRAFFVVTLPNGRRQTRFHESSSS